MEKRTKPLFYIALAAYAVLLFFFMTALRLPMGEIMSGRVRDMTGGKVLFQATHVVPRLPLRYQMEDVRLGLMRGNTLTRDRLEMLSIEAEYLRFFLGFLPLAFEGRVSAGRFSGRMGVSILSGLDRGYVSAQGNNLSLESFDFIRHFSPRQMTGTLRGQIAVKGDLKDPSKWAGSGNFQVDRGSIETKINISGIKIVPFDVILFSFTLKNGILSLKQAKMDGPMFSGQYEGEIKLNTKLKRSALQINGDMTPGPLLKNNELARQFLSRMTKGNRPIRIIIRGTLERPAISWKRG
jgi:type II secretion system protein N